MRKYQDNSDVYDQPIPEVVPEEQDVHADHDGYHREHVKHDDCSASHRFILVCTMLDRLTCRPRLIRALGSAATEGWPPRQIGGYTCALREQYQSRGKASRSADPVVLYTYAPLLGAGDARTCRIERVASGPHYAGMTWRVTAESQDLQASRPAISADRSSCRTQLNRSVDAETLDPERSSLLVDPHAMG
jgi:hypothetical protein